jgi:hypothetical protein
MRTNPASFTWIIMESGGDAVVYDETHSHSVGHYPSEEKALDERGNPVGRQDIAQEVGFLVRAERLVTGGGSQACRQCQSLGLLALHLSDRLTGEHEGAKTNGKPPQSFQRQGHQSTDLLFWTWCS